MIEHTVQMSRLVASAQLAVLPGVHGSYIGEAGTVKNGSKLPGVTAVLVEEFLNE